MSCAHAVQTQGIGLPPLVLESTPVIGAASPGLSSPVASQRIDFIAAINTEQSCTKMKRKKVNTSKQVYELTLYQLCFIMKVL